MSRYALLLGVIVLGCGAMLGGCSSSDDGGGGPDPTVSTLAKVVSGEAGRDGDDGFLPGRGCEGATLPSGVTAGGEITPLTCLNRGLPGTPPR